MDFKDNVLKKLNTTNLFNVTYKKDKFALSDKEYPIGYTSYLVMDTDSRFIDENIFEDLRIFTEELLNKDFIRTDFLDYHSKIISAIDILSQYEIFKIFDIKKCKKIINELFSEEKIKLYEEYDLFTKNEYRIKISEKLDELLKVSVDLEMAFLIGFFISSAVKELEYYSETEKSHSKFIKREYYMTSNIIWITNYQEWKHIKSIGYERKTIESLNNDKKTIEERFFIISFENDIKMLNLDKIILTFCM